MINDPATNHLHNLQNQIQTLKQQNQQLKNHNNALEWEIHYITQTNWLTNPLQKTIQTTLNQTNKHIITPLYKLLNPW